MSEAVVHSRWAGFFYRLGALVALGAWGVVGLSACSPSAARAPATDWLIIEQGLAIELTPQAARWEAFATPEADGWLPAPTDMETLLAEMTLSPDDLARVNRLPAWGRAHQTLVAPNGARHWLADDFRSLMANLAKQETAPAPGAWDCRSIPVRGRVTMEDKVAFICVAGSRALLHVVLSHAP